MFDITTYKKQMANALDYFKSELNKVRTGRAHPSMLDSIKVEVYGTFLPLNQAANVTAPEAQMILITPFDPGNIANISAAIRADQTLGLNPSDDGRVVRVPIPPLTEERRRQIAKQTSEKVEEAKVRLRSVRQDAQKDIKKLELPEDVARRADKDIDDLIKDFQNQVDQLFKEKEAEIMKV